MVNTSENTCSQQVISILMEGAQEMLGVENLDRVIGLAGNGSGAACLVNNQRERPAQVGYEGAALLCCAGLPDGLEKRYGLVGGRGLAVRIGRASFKYMLLRHGDNLGLTSTDFRLQRAPRRMLEGLHILSGQLGRECGDSISIVDSGEYWEWRSERCPVCRGRQAADPCCYLTVGLLQEFLSWAGGGRYYPVQELECRAMGARTCSYRIEKRPID